jgi:hypothetical protein
MYLPVDVEKSKSIGMNDYHHFEKPWYTKILDVLKSE